MVLDYPSIMWNCRPCNPPPPMTNTNEWMQIQSFDGNLFIPFSDSSYRMNHTSLRVVFLMSLMSLHGIKTTQTRPISMLMAYKCDWAYNPIKRTYKWGGLIYTRAGAGFWFLVSVFWF